MVGDHVRSELCSEQWPGASRTRSVRWMDAPDHRPPRLQVDERETVLALLQYQRESFLRKTDDIDDVGATGSSVPSGTTLLWLTNHMADAERTWVLHRFAGTDPTDDPPRADTITVARQRYRSTWPVADAVIASATLETTSQAFDDGPPVNLRWILGHLLEETARHAGHADILRELLDGTTGR